MKTSHTMRLTPILSGLLSCLLFGCFAEARAAEPGPAEKIYREAKRYTEALDTLELDGKTTRATKDIRMETLSKYLEMAEGEKPVDQAFFENIHLAAAADRLLPLFGNPVPADITPPDFDSSDGKVIPGLHDAARLLLARGHQLCQQGKNSEGRDWFLRAHQLARTVGGKREHAAACIDSAAQDSAARHDATWPEAERLEYFRKISQLKPLPDSATAAMKIYAEASRYFDGLREKKLPKDSPKENAYPENEYDLFRRMGAGEQPVDQAFFERIGLAATADRFLTVFDFPAPPDMCHLGGFKPYMGLMEIAWLFQARGHQLCQQGKGEEGRIWFLRVHQLARNVGGERNFLQMMAAGGMDTSVQSAAARYVSIWPVAERLAYIEKLDALTPLPDLATVIINDRKAWAPQSPEYIPGYVGVAVQRVNWDRRLAALKLALRHGGALEAAQVAALSDANGKPLKLGTLPEYPVNGRMCILRELISPDEGVDQAVFLIIGPIK